MEFSQQEYWSRLPFPSPGDLPGAEIEPMSPALTGRFFTTEPPGKPICLPVQEMQVQSLGGEDPLEEEMAPHSSILAWRIPRTEESGRLQAMGSRRVRHDQVTEQEHADTDTDTGSSCYWIGVCYVRELQLRRSVRDPDQQS